MNEEEKEEETEEAMEFPTLEAGWMLLMGWLYQQAEVSPESLTAEEQIVTDFYCCYSKQTQRHDDDHGIEIGIRFTLIRNDVF